MYLDHGFDAAVVVMFEKPLYRVFVDVTGIAGGFKVLQKEDYLHKDLSIEVSILHLHGGFIRHPV